MLTDADWRWIFLINVPVGLVVGVTGWARLPHDRPVARGPLPDLAGSLTLVLAIGGLTLAVVQAGTWGWTSPATLACVAAAVALLAFLVRRSARHPSPVLPLSLLRIPSFAAANLVTVLYGATFAAAVLSITMWCQTVWRWSPLVTGLALTPANVLLIVVASGGGPLVRRLGAQAVTVLGCLLMAAGGLWWATTTGAPVAYVVGLLPGLVLTRIGIGLTLPALNGLATQDLPAAQLATGSAVNAMVRQVGMALGFSAVVSVIVSASNRGAVAGYHAGWIFMTATAVAAGVLAIGLTWFQRQKSLSTSNAENKE